MPPDLLARPDTWWAYAVDVCLTGPEQALYWRILDLWQWGIVVGAGWALLVFVTRNRTEAPPAPRGLASGRLQLAAVVFEMVAATVLYSVERGAVQPWPGAAWWLGLVPLALLSLKPGVRAARARARLGA